ncbi:MAG: hypothetical protein FWG57_05965 [Endomicrobia bacterium]|nr:hypothetical protein [Endomicrobiia bacterium]
MKKTPNYIQSRLEVFRGAAVKIIFSVFICCFFYANLFSAENSLTIIPIRAEITIEAGGYYENEYSVTNNYDGTVDVRVSVAKKESYVGNKDISLDSWLFVDTTTFTLQKGETKSVPYRIQTSTHMTGNISGQVSFTTKPPDNEMMQARTTLPIYVNIRGTEKIDFRILSVKVEFNEYIGKIIGALTVQNKGNVHIMPRGSFFISKGKNKIYSGPVREGLVIFSGTTRGDFEFQIPKGITFAPGNYKMHITIGAKGKEVKKTVKVTVDKDGKMIVKK